MKFSRDNTLIAIMALALLRVSVHGATDPEIDRLLKKLPPPEKLVHVDDRILRVNDPALSDPLTKQIEAAAKAKQSKRALELSRQLAARYPSSAVANYYVGESAAGNKRYAEASTAFRRALALQPRFVLVHYDLAFVEWEQRHFDTALQHFRAVTKLEPRAAAGWATLSICAEMVGSRAESVMAARRLVELAPRQPAAWVRLAVAEKNVGHHDAAVRALNQAVAVQRGAKASSKQKASAPTKKKKS